MITDQDVQQLMELATSEDKEHLTGILQKMNLEDRRYFDGYVDGYAEAVRHVQAAQKEE